MDQKRQTVFIFKMMFSGFALLGDNAVNDNTRRVLWHYAQKDEWTLLEMFAMMEHLQNNRVPGLTQKQGGLSDYLIGKMESLIPTFSVMYETEIYDLFCYYAEHKAEIVQMSNFSYESMHLASKEEIVDFIKGLDTSLIGEIEAAMTRTLGRPTSIDDLNKKTNKSNPSGDLGGWGLGSKRTLH